VFVKGGLFGRDVKFVDDEDVRSEVFQLAGVFPRL
jgi:hypothetical protein